MKPIEETSLLVKAYLLIVEAGVRKRAAYEILQKLGYTSTQNQLRRQTKLLEETGSISTRTKKSGAKPKLNDEQLDDLFGWVKEKQVHNEAFEYKDAQKWVYDTYGVVVTQRTVGNYLRDLGFKPAKRKQRPLSKQRARKSL